MERNNLMREKKEKNPLKIIDTRRSFDLFKF